MILLISILFTILFIFCFYNLRKDTFQGTPTNKVINYHEIEGIQINKFNSNINEAKLYIFPYSQKYIETKTNNIIIDINNEETSISTLELRNIKLFNSRLLFKFTMNDMNDMNGIISILSNSLKTWDIVLVNNNSEYNLVVVIKGLHHIMKDNRSMPIILDFQTKYTLEVITSETILEVKLSSLNKQSDVYTLEKNIKCDNPLPSSFCSDINGESSCNYSQDCIYKNKNCEPKYKCGLNDKNVYYIGSNRKDTMFNGIIEDIEYSSNESVNTRMTGSTSMATRTNPDKLEINTNISKCKFPYQLKGSESVDTLKRLSDFGLINYDKKGIHYSHLEYNNNKENCKNNCNNFEEYNECNQQICNKKCERVGVCSFDSTINNTRHEIDCIKKCLSVNDCTIEYCKNQCYECKSKCFWNKYSDERESLMEDELGRPKNVRISVKYISPDGTKASIKWQINSNIKMKLSNKQGNGGFFTLLYKTHNEEEGVIINKMPIINCSNQCEYIYTDLIPNTTYTAAIKSYNKYGIGEMSNLISFKTTRRKINPITNIEDIEYKDPNPNIEICK